MSYQLYDIDGYVGDIATTLGLEELHIEVNVEKTHVLLAEFIKQGASFVTEELLEDISDFLDNQSEDSVIKTTANLISLLRKSRLVAFITNNPDETNL